MKFTSIFEDFLRTGQRQVKEAIWAGESLPDPSVDPTSSDQFSRHVEKLKKLFEAGYSATALSALSATDLEEETAIWKIVCQFCADSLRGLQPLLDKFPGCGTRELYLLVFRCKVTARKRQKEILEEMTCQTDLSEPLLLESDLFRLTNLYHGYYDPVSPTSVIGKQCEKEFNDKLRFLYERRASNEKAALSFSEFRCMARRECRALLKPRFQGDDQYLPCRPSATEGSPEVNVELDPPGELALGLTVDQF